MVVDITEKVLSEQKPEGGEGEVIEVPTGRASRQREQSFQGP